MDRFRALRGAGALVAIGTFLALTILDSAGAVTFSSGIRLKLLELIYGLLGLEIVIEVFIKQLKSFDISIGMRNGDDEE